MIYSFTVKLDLQSCWTDNLKVILFKENKTLLADINHLTKGKQYL